MKCKNCGHEIDSVEWKNKIWFEHIVGEFADTICSCGCEIAEPEPVEEKRGAINAVLKSVVENWGEMGEAREPIKEVKK